MIREIVWENRKVVKRKGAVAMKVKTGRESQKEWSRREKGQEGKRKSIFLFGIFWSAPLACPHLYVIE